MSGARRFRRTVLCCALLSSVASYARADAAVDAWLTIHVDPTCSTSDRIEAGVVRVLGKPLSEVALPESHAELWIEPHEAAWRTRARFETANGVGSERVVLAASCREAVDVAVVVLATSLAEARAAAPAALQEPAPRTSTPDATTSTPDATTGTQALSAKPAPSPVVVGEPTPRARQGREQQSSRGRSAGVSVSLAPRVGARVGFDWGVLPDPALMLEVRAELARRNFGVAAMLGVHLPSSLALPGTAGLARVWLWRAGMEGCYGLWAERALSPRGCLGLELGSFNARGDGIRNSSSSSATWSAGWLSLGARWRVTEYASFDAQVAGILAFRRFDVVLRSGEGYRTGSTSLRPSLGFNFQW